MNEPDSVTLVIRTIGERTERACRAAILAQGVDPAQVVTVREAPFSRALRVGFEAGIAAGRPWTFCVDADVILRPGALQAMLAHAQRQPERVFEVQGRALDKLSVTLRSVGNHMYRTVHLPQMISVIPKEGTAVRPEAESMRRMEEERGFRWVSVPYVVGIHDFEQYNRDIFRKCFTHAQKHLHLLPDLVRLARSRAGSDLDFAIALHGYAEGLRAAEPVRIDVRHRPFAKRFSELRLPEKIDECDLTAATAEEILREWAQAPDIRVRALPVSALKAVGLGPDARFSRWGRLVAMFQREHEVRGLFPLIPYALGSAMEIAGQRLKNLGWPKNSQRRK